MSFSSLWNVRREEKSHTKAVSADTEHPVLGTKNPTPTPQNKEDSENYEQDLFLKISVEKYFF